MEEEMKAESIEEEAEVDEEEKDETILGEEFDSAIKNLRVEKAPGIDDFSAELIKATGEKLRTALYNLICEVYETGKMPEDFERCVMVPIPKKASATKCEDFCTSLISHASKILTSVPLQRIDKKLDKVLSEDQLDFKRGRGTQEAILALRLLIQKKPKKRTNMCVSP
ncbi:uncharacterized protein LOC142317557 [Lycorma delicatula]|uniref:uncharacterized protein LOC142317557 n=1 Tax=Lycorma delicatula TaxID=130591 RepID=UPI003F50F1F9